MLALVPVSTARRLARAPSTLVPVQFQPLVPIGNTSRVRVRAVAGWGRGQRL
jgi:hypothetical protein